jgi:phenylacetate-coenzyme A ligase PaaK-like adenylate-forming protein
VSAYGAWERASFTDVSDDEQGALLRAQLDYAAGHSPYYRAALGPFLPLSGADALRQLPFLTERELRAQGNRLVCVSAAEVARIVSLRSSGTVDAPKRLRFTRGDLQRTVDFFREGMQWLCGPGDRVGVFFPCAAPDGIGDLLCRALAAFGARPAAFGPVSDAAEAAARVRETAPDVLVGMPWQLRALALFLPALRPKAVLLSADYVPETLRRFLAARWQTEVVTHYGMTESGYGLAVQHPGVPGMYVRRSDFYLEIVDPASGAPLPYGTVGELVLTTLRREAMPLIRYRTGDLAVLSDQKKIARVPGRLGFADEFYRLQERLAPLPWLLDYVERDGALSAVVTAEAPPDAERRLADRYGCGPVVCRRGTSLLSGEKRRPAADHSAQ